MKIKNIVLVCLSVMTLINANVSARTYDDYDDYESKQIRSVSIVYDDEYIDKLTVMATNNVQLKAEVFPKGAPSAVRWRSTDTKIATVNSSGLVKAKSAGSCEIYAVSEANTAKKTYIYLTVTEYKKYPERITLSASENAVLETDRDIRFYAEIYPPDATERKITYSVVNGWGNISENGVFNTSRKGKVTVRAYSEDKAVYGDYTFDVKYSDNHFSLVKTDYNVRNNRDIILTFSEDVSSYNVWQYIFLSRDEAGNGEDGELNITVSGNKVTLSPKMLWQSGENYIFIDSMLSGQSWDMLGKNIKYKFTVRD